MTETSPNAARPRRLFRGWRRGVSIAAGLVAIYAILGFFVVPPIVRSQIVKLARTKLHREATVGRVRFNPFTLAGTIENLNLKGRDGGALFSFDRLAVDLQVSGIFRRALRFREIALDHPSFDARILPDGRPGLADLFEPDPSAKPTEAKASLPRLIVDRFVLRGGKVEFVDESRTPRFVQALDPLDLEVHGLTTIPDESGDNAMTIGFGQDQLLRWSGRQSLDPLRLEGRVEITGIHLSRVWEYAAPGNSLDLAEGRADVALAYDIQRAADGSFSMALKDATAKARGVVLRPRGGSENWLEIPSVELTGVRATWPESRVDVAAVRVTGANALVRRDPKGDVNWLAALAPGKEAAPRPATQAPTTRAWTAKIAAIDVTEGSVTMDDLAVSPGVKTSLTGIGVRLENVTSDLKAPVKTTVTATINGSGHASVTGTVVPDPRTLDLDVSVSSLDLTPLQPYSVHLPGAESRRGSAGLSGRLYVSQGHPAVLFEGSGSVDSLQIAGAGEDRLVAWDRAQLRGVRATFSPDRVRVTEIQLDGAFMKLRIDREGNVNLAKLAHAAEAPAPQPAQARPRPAAAAIPVEIVRIVIKNATADYTDESLILPFGTKIHTLNGDIRDLSTTGAAAARLALEGRVADAGYVKADGTVRIADPFASTDVIVLFRNVNMPDLTPYSAQFAGYSLEKGALDLDVHYTVQDRHLVGDHKVVAKDMVLGPKVEGAKGPGLPVRLAVALLRDKDGRIDLDVPIEGTVDSPEFNYKAVFWQALKKILGNIVKAPFRAIGRLFGADKEDLELVGFPSGRSDLPAPEQETLAKMAAELAKRGEISLEVEGRFDPVTDTAALRKIRLEAKIDARRTPDSNLDTILETIYKETFSKERLEAERLKFMPAPPTPPPAEGKSKKSGKHEPLHPPSPEGASKQNGEKASPPPPSVGGASKKSGANAPAPAQPPPAAFDAGAFYDSLRKQLLAAETISDPDLAGLARSRAAAIAAVLTAPGGLDPSRVRVVDPSPVKRKKQGSDLVASEMTMSAKD